MTYEIDQKVEDTIKALQKHADKVLEMQELLELAVESYDSTMSELANESDSDYHRQVVPSDEDDMTFCEMVGLLGKTYIYGAETINEARRPMTLRVLQLAKNTLDGFTEECGYLIDELVALYYSSYDDINLFSERARRSILHHSTSMVSILRQVARDKFGEFMPLDAIDQYFNPFIAEMEDYVSKKVVDIKDVVPPDISEVMGATVDELKESVLVARRQLVDTVVSYAIVMVGEEEGRELAIKVFGVEEIEQAQ